MITLRTSKERKHEQDRQSFDENAPSDVLADGFATLAMLNEDDLAPRTRVARHAHHNAEVIIYVRSGAVAYDDSLGSAGVIRAGEFRRTEMTNSVARGAWNESHKERAQIFHLWLRLGDGEHGGADEQRRFSAADRRGGLCLVASQDARKGSLRLHQDASVYSALLESGQHVVHALEHGRRSWLHIVDGAGALGIIAMNTGDGAGLSGEHAVSFTARDRTEILLIDFGKPVPKA